MLRVVALVPLMVLAACVAARGDPPALPPLAGDRAQPAAALIEQVLREHFAGAGAAPPTTCVSLAPRALTAAQEEALMARFVRLAPASRCRTSPGGPVDS